MKNSLISIENSLIKRWLPYDKIVVFIEFVYAWEKIDRIHALRLIVNLPKNEIYRFLFQSYIKKPFCKEEWIAKMDSAGPYGYSIEVDLVLKLLEDTEPFLDLPNTLIQPIINKIFEDLNINESRWPEGASIEPYIDRIKGCILLMFKFLKIVAQPDNLNFIEDIYKSIFRDVLTFTLLKRFWPAKFELLEKLTLIGIQLGIITRQTCEELTNIVPKHLTDFYLSTALGYLSNENNSIEFLKFLLDKTIKKEQAEAWFLVCLVKRNQGIFAYNIAKKSERAIPLTQRICRAIVCSLGPEASKILSNEDIPDDLITKLLITAPGKPRLFLLKSLTDSGNKSLPSSLWVDNSFKNVVGNKVDLYLKYNPLYSSVKLDLQKEKHFDDFLRFSGFGEFNYKFIDEVLLEILYSWVNDNYKEVESLLQNMWASIIPRKDIQMVDFLRKAIFERCTTLFSVCPDVLHQNFLTWLKNSKGSDIIKRKDDNTAVSYPCLPTSIGGICIKAAIVISEFSDNIKDRLIEIAFTQNVLDNETTQLAATLYNKGKQILDFEIPSKLKLVPGNWHGDKHQYWQIGIINNAIEPLRRAFIEEGSN